MNRNNEEKTLVKHVSCNCSCKFDGKNAIQIKNRILINVEESVKNTRYMKKNMFGILLRVVANMVNI